MISLGDPIEDDPVAQPAGARKPDPRAGASVGFLGRDTVQPNGRSRWLSGSSSATRAMLGAIVLKEHTMIGRQPRTQ